MNTILVCQSVIVRDLRFDDFNYLFHSSLVTEIAANRFESKTVILIRQPLAGTAVQRIGSK